MKNILFYLFLILGGISYGQIATVPEEEFVYDSILDKSHYIKLGYRQMYIDDIPTAGNELALYTKHHYRGTILNLTGVVVAGGGFLLYNDGMDNLGGATIVAGGILSLIGFIYTLEAPIHIKRASIIMNNNGVGINYKF